MHILDQIAENLELGDDEQVAELTTQAIQQNLTGQQILNDGLLKGMGVIGSQFKNHEIFLPDVLLAARAMHAGMGLIKPLLIHAGIPAKETIVLGTVQGDLHDIGKNLVAIVLKGAGYEIVDLGTDVSPEKFIRAVREHNSPIIGISALLTTTMPMMKDVVELFKQEDLYGKVKIVIGGAPVTQEYADKIGADAYAYDGSNAVQKIEALLAS
jgi:corrinoid protein of di/trimethylamine methyltransferase